MMAGYREYTSRVVKVQAMQIVESDSVSMHNGQGVLTHSPNTGVVKFTASTEPQVGDYIICLSKEDTYHCPRAVFEAKYIL